jgi:hypothetical protein
VCSHDLGYRRGCGPPGLCANPQGEVGVLTTQTRLNFARLRAGNSRFFSGTGKLGGLSRFVRAPILASIALFIGHESVIGDPHPIGILNAYCQVLHRVQMMTSS